MAEAREQGFAVFSCRPAGAETAFSFAALADLLKPLLPERLERLPSPQRRALSAALLLEEADGSAPDERAIAFAVSKLLGEQDGPLLVAVDDVQWLDAASASVLAFAARRLAASAGCDSRRTPEQRRRGATARARARVSGWTAAAAAARPLECRRDASFATGTARRLVSATDARPASRHIGWEPVLRARARACTRSVRVRGPRPGSGLTVPTSLTELVSARLAALSVEVRELLEPLALLSEPTVSIVEAMTSEPTTVSERLRVAQAAGIVELNEAHVRFSHPLLSAQVEAELDPGRRRSLHRRLAQLVGDPEQRARHLALGARAPSAKVADELETASASAASRGASGAAAELAELSVSLTPAAAGDLGRRRRQLLAADLHYASGDAERSRLILEPLLEQLRTWCRARAGVAAARPASG